MEKNKIIIFGGGETAELAYEYFTHDSPYEIVAFSIDREFIKSDTIQGLPVIPIDEIKIKCPPESYSAFVAASSTQLNRIRRLLYYRVKAMSYSLVSYVSSKAFIWHNVKIGDNCFILEDNTLQPFTEIRNNVVMWSGNHLGHRSIIKDHCFISSQVVISGYCEIEDNCFLGVNSTIENNVLLKKDSFVGAGAIIRKSTQEKSFMQSTATESAKFDSHKIFKIRES